MSTKSLAQKLFIKANTRVLILDPPAAFMDALGELPENITLLHNKDGKFDFIQCFAQSQSELEALIPASMSHLNEAGRLWLAYPKGTSKKYKAEINRDSIWKYALTVGLTPVSLVSVDEDWSSLRLKPKD